MESTRKPQPSLVSNALPNLTTQRLVCFNFSRDSLIIKIFL